MDRQRQYNHLLLIILNLIWLTNDAWLHEEIETYFPPSCPTMRHL